MFLHDYLKNAKSTQDMVFIFRENGLIWNEKQIELYALLDPAIYVNKDGKWTVQQDERRQVILNAIEEAIGYRTMVKIDPDVISHISGHHIIPMLEIKEVAISTGRYESPRKNILRIKR